MSLGALNTASTKPWWTWKSPKCSEIAHFDIAFAVKEYLQNQVGQIQKEKQVREWSDWCIDDLRDRELRVREDCKARLVRTYPGLLTGPHGASIRNDAGWTPVYVVSGIVPKDQLNTPYDNDFIMCTVLWYFAHPTSGDIISSALTFFNNHLDQDASFSTFVVDGATTSRSNTDAVGEKGKGFILATQYLHELLEELDETEPVDVPERKWYPGVSFRVGYQVGELSWRNSRSQYATSEKQLKVSLDDLTPWTTEQFLEKLGIFDEKENAGRKQDTMTKLAEVKRKAAVRVLRDIYRRRFAQRLSDRSRASATTDVTDPSHEISRTRPDEVAITVIGLPGHLSPVDAFSGIYGIVDIEHAWRVLPAADAPTYFFKREGSPLFYHRDQIIRSGPSLNRLSINYRGPLDLSADRTAVMKHTRSYSAYKANLSKAAHLAFEFLPDLAKELALDILTDHGHSGSTLSRVLRPVDTKIREAYRIAFDSAWRELDPKILPQKSLYPYPASSTSDLRLIEELGMVGRPVPEHVMLKILQASGAFTPIHHHAESILLRSHPHQNSIAGITRLKNAINTVFPTVSTDDVLVVDYPYSNPRIVWDTKAKRFVMGVPEKCEEHTDGGCLCWIGPNLFGAWDSWRQKNRKKESPTRTVLCRAYMRSMEGAVDFYEPKGPQRVKSDSDMTTRGLEATQHIKEDTAETIVSDSPHKRRRLSVETEATLSMPQSPGSQAFITQKPMEGIISHSQNNNALTGIFHGVLELCQRGLRESAIIEAEQVTLKTENVRTETAIHTLQDQAEKTQDEVQQLRNLLELKESELDYTRGMLTAKWANPTPKRVREV